MLQGRPIRLEAGRLVDQHGTLAGAHLSMIDAVHNAVQAMKIRLEDALIMVSRTPACFLGFGDNLGQMAPGYSANLVAFAGRDVLQTWINGNAAMQKRDHAEGDKRL